MKIVKLVCANCNKEFEKDAKEHRRQIKKGNDRFFCGLSCVAFKRTEENPPKGNPQNLIADNRRDEYTPFRWFILRSEYRDRNKNCGCDVTVEYLKQLWEQQSGICPITGWTLVLPHNSNGCTEYSPKNASLDRIDNSIGYMQGNVRFVAVMANLARQCFTDEQLIEFCEAVCRNY